MSGDILKCPSQYSGFLMTWMEVACWSKILCEYVYCRLWGSQLMFCLLHFFYFFCCTSTLHVFIDFPTCLSTYAFVYFCAPGSHRQDTSSARSRMLCRQSENGRQTSTTWSSFLVLNASFMHSGGVALDGDLQGGWDVCFQCYQPKACIAFSKIFYCTFKCLSKYDTRVIEFLKN